MASGLVLAPVILYDAFVEYRRRKKRGRRQDLLRELRLCVRHLFRSVRHDMNRAQAKTERVMAAIEHREADRVPVGEFFWTNFVRRCRKEFGEGFIRFI